MGFFDRIKEAFEQVAQGEARKAEHRARNHDQKHRLPATHHCRLREDNEALQCPTCVRIVTVSFWKTTFGESRERSIQIGGAHFVEKYDWKQPNRIFVVQTGSINQAKVFKAHAVPQGLCGNLINALKLLANQ